MVSDLGKLLIAEDDPTFATILKKRMQMSGFECRVCADSSATLLESRSFRPTHILLDMNLGQGSGLQLIKPLRNLLPDARIILLTGYASIATAVDAIHLGADDYLAKPADTATLLKALTDRAGDIGLSEGELPMTPERLEWEHLQQVLRVNGGNVSATARQLGMHRRTLQRKLQKKPLMVSAPKQP